jgi:hypothetical protein
MYFLRRGVVSTSPNPQAGEPFYEHEFQEEIKADLKVKNNAFVEESISSSLIGSCVAIKSGIKPASPYNNKKSLPI